MRVWLITWEWLGNHASVENKIIGILSSRRSKDIVEKFVKFIYANEALDLSENLYYLNRQKTSPVKCQYHSMSSTITCGHNPYICARLVNNFKITPIDEDYENVEWQELPVYEVNNDIPIKIHDGAKQSYKHKKKNPNIH